MHLLPYMKCETICRPWIDDLRGKMTKAQKEELRSKQDDSIKMVNKYVDGSGTLRVWWPYMYTYKQIAVLKLNLRCLFHI